MELGLAFPLRAFEASYAPDQSSEQYILVPCLITDLTEQFIQMKHKEMTSHRRCTSAQYKFGHSNDGFGAYQDLIKAFTETFLWKGRGGKVLNTYHQKIENRGLGITGGFHGILRWTDREESDELFEFLILHQHEK